MRGLPAPRLLSPHASYWAWLIECVECSNLDIIIINEFVIPKYAYFHSRSLLNAFHALFKSLYVLNKEAFLESITRELGVVISGVTQKANAVSNYFTLLDWVNQVLLLSSQNYEKFMMHLDDLITWQTTLLERCLAESKKQGMRDSAIHSTRACLRGIFQQKESTWNRNVVESCIRVMTGAKVPPFIAGVSLGMIAGVCKRLRNPTPRDVIEASKPVFYEFFIKQIIGSRVSVPSYVLV